MGFTDTIDSYLMDRWSIHGVHRPLNQNIFCRSLNFLLHMKQLLGYSCNDLFSRFEQQIYFRKNWLRRWIPRRTVMGTTNRRGGLVPKYLEFWNLGTEIDSLNFVTTWQDGPSWARRTVTDSSRNWVSELCDGSNRTDRRRHDGPSQAAQSQAGSDFC